MAKRFATQQEIDAFLEEPRLAVLMYRGSRAGPTGVPVWYDWDGQTLRMFAARNSPKVQHLSRDPNVSVLVTNKVGEPEGWVAFDGPVTIADFDAQEWSELLDRVAPRYWDLSDASHAKVIEEWRMVPNAFVSIQLAPMTIRTGA